MKYRSLDLSNIEDADVQLVESCYKLWRETYEPISEKAGTKLAAESFFRSHRLNVIENDDGPVSLSLSSFLNMGIRGLTELKYFEPLAKDLQTAFAVRHPRVMTVEWVTVRPEERARFSKIRQPDLIMGCTLQTFKYSAAQVAMGYSRVDLGADRIGEQFGAVGQGGTSMFGIECRVMTITKKGLTPHRFAVVQRAIDELFVDDDQFSKAG